jgi:hypothetical protein
MWRSREGEGGRGGAAGRARRARSARVRPPTARRPVGAAAAVTPAARWGAAAWRARRMARWPPAPPGRPPRPPQGARVRGARTVQKIAGHSGVWPRRRMGSSKRFTAAHASHHGGGFSAASQRRGPGAIAGWVPPPGRGRMVWVAVQEWGVGTQKGAVAAGTQARMAPGGVCIAPRAWRAHRAAAARLRAQSEGSCRPRRIVSRFLALEPTFCGVPAQAGEGRAPVRGGARLSGPWGGACLLPRRAPRRERLPWQAPAAPRAAL